MLKSILLALVFVVIASCSDGDWLRQYLPEHAQDAELVFARNTNFDIPSCSVAAYKPRRIAELGVDYVSGPIEDIYPETSMVSRIIGTAADGCESPVELGFNRNGYYDFLKAPSIRYKWEGGHAIVIYAPDTGLFWVITADT